LIVHRYLWVALQIDNICSQPTDKAIVNALENIPKDLPETFNRILRNLRNNNENTSLTAYSVMLFRIVAAARRPLTLAELREAVSVEQGETAWDPDQLVNDMQKLIHCCGSLVVVDEEDFTVRFIHRSVRQFLCSHLVDECVKEYKMNLESANLDLGNICVTYLNSERHISQLVKRKPQFIASSATLIQAIPSANIAGKMATRLLNSKEQITHRMRSSLEAAGALSSSFSSHDQSYNIFLPYAQENWLYHTTQLCRSTHPRIWHLWRRLVTGEVKTAQFPWSQEECIVFDPAFVDFVLKNHQWNLLFIFIGHAKGSQAMANLLPIYKYLKEQVEVVEHSLVNSPEIRQVVQILEPYMRSNGITKLWGTPALQVVARLGLAECVHFLLTNGAAVDLQGGSENETALLVACHEGHEAIVKLLLTNGAAVNFQGGSENETALLVACHEGHEAIVKLLLTNGAEVDLQGDYPGKTLYTACSRGHEAIVMLLLKNGAEVKLQGGLYGTALQVACVYGQEEIVKRLLDNGAEVNLQGGRYDTALQVACVYGQEEIVKRLLDNGAEVNLQGGRYDTALQAACIYGHGTIVKLLLENGADVNLQGGRDGTALVAACGKGRTSIAKYLLENGADVNLQGGGKYDTALEAAKEHGDHDIVKLLLEHGAKKKRFIIF
jgi:ankyrin repeat protein